ncbi:MAG: chromosome segregation protein SMC, partial [Oscillospiraceae bacterium]|nr:chromosome segregation protein SMC [Oscillospiraceae bacterium]
MVLKSLEVQGFKSFPDKTLIRFGDDITAIVGPNGSGKSNISDAILWVMGEQSSKTLRGAKMEDVIFGGTQKRKAVGFAEATLTLDNSDRALPYDADEVMVTRRYYRSGDSEFYINKQSARLKDIHELFMDTGLGREGYSNIGQGRIDEILSLKSGDRREIFEEAAGISKYRHRKEETERKLAHTEDNLLRIGDKVSELELQLEPLKNQSEKAKKYLELKDELMGVEVAVWLEQLDKLSAAAKKAQEDYTSAAFVLQQEKDNLEELYRQTEALGEKLRREDAGLETVRIESGMLEASKEQLAGQMAVLRSNVENNDANIARIREELAGSESRSGGIDAQIAEISTRIAELDGALQQGAAQLQQLQGELNAMTANAQGRTRQFLELRTKQTTLTAEIAGRGADVRALEESIRQYSERAEQLREDLAAGSGRRRDAQLAMDACNRTLNTAKEQVTAAQNTITGYELRRNARIQKLDALDRELRDLTGELDSVSAKARVFRAMERDFESYQKSVRMVMQEAQRGRLSGIHGPVSRLIRTDDDYTVAIEIALGGAMQQIVVGAESDGKAAIGYLKRTGGGRATFLPMNTISGRRLQENGLEIQRGFVGIASELVRSEQCYRGIVENLLGRTVICENIDCAIAMAKQYRNHFKIVTLDGQVMNPGGSMTGGSVNKEAGILSRANELEKLTKREQELTTARADREKEMKEARRSVDEVEYQLTAARDRLREAEDQVLLLQGQQKQYEILLNAIEEASQAAEREQQTIADRLDADRQRLAAQHAKLQIFTVQLAETEGTLAALEGEESETARRTEDLTERMTRLRTGCAAMEAERTTALSHVEDLRQLQQSLEGDRQQKLSVAQAMEADNRRLLEQIAAVAKQQEENETSLTEVRVKLNRVLASRAETEAAKTKTERESQEKSKDILNMERACALLEQKKLTANMEERQIVDKLWDSYGLTPGTAPEKRGHIDSVTAGNRRIAEL